MNRVNEKDYAANVSITIDVTVNCRPVISRMPWRRPMIDPSAGLSKAGIPFGVKRSAFHLFLPCIDLKDHKGLAICFEFEELWENLKDGYSAEHRTPNVFFLTRSVSAGPLHTWPLFFQ